MRFRGWRSPQQIALGDHLCVLDLRDHQPSLPGTWRASLDDITRAGRRLPFHQPILLPFISPNLDSMPDECLRDGRVLREIGATRAA